MARYQAAALLFTFTAPDNKQYILLSQQDPAWRAHRTGHVTADMPAMFPGGMVDPNELTRITEPAASFVRYAQAAFPHEALKAEAAAAAMREVFEETGINALDYDSGKTLHFAGSITLQGNSTKHVGIFTIDAGLLDEAQFQQLKASLSPKEDCLTAAFVPVETITASRDSAKEGNKSYTVKDYLLHRKMRQGYEPMPTELVGGASSSSILKNIDAKRKSGRLSEGLKHSILSRYDVLLLPSNAGILENFLDKEFPSTPALSR